MILMAATRSKKKLGQRQNKNKKSIEYPSQIVLNSPQLVGELVIAKGIVFWHKSSCIPQRLGLCKQRWIMAHHFVPNFTRELSNNSKIKM